MLLRESLEALEGRPGASDVRGVVTRVNRVTVWRHHTQGFSCSYGNVYGNFRVEPNESSAEQIGGWQWGGRLPPRHRKNGKALLLFCFFQVLFLPRTLSCTFKSENYPTESLGSLKVQFSHMFVSECLWSGANNCSFFFYRKLLV